LSVSLTLRRVAFKGVCEDFSLTELADVEKSGQTSGPVSSGLCEFWFPYKVVCKDFRPCRVVHILYVSEENSASVFMVGE